MSTIAHVHSLATPLDKHRSQLTFAHIALADQTPQDVGAVMAVGRSVKSLFAEEMSTHVAAADTVNAALIVAGHVLVITSSSSSSHIVGVSRRRSLSSR